ncbi:MAG: hypothetical protein M3Y44_11800 [Actinomycetota bacterium]|nr:hypothetical protein [Actinomycetota bacterium]
MADLALAVTAIWVPWRGPRLHATHHRDGAGIVRVVLVHLPGVEQPHPRRELGLHVDHTLNAAEQRLGEELAQATRTLDSPYAIRPCLRPQLQPLDWSPRAIPRIWPSTVSAWSSTTAVCDPLCGSTPIITPSMPTSKDGTEERPWRARL